MGHNQSVCSYNTKPNPTETFTINQPINSNPTNITVSNTDEWKIVKFPTNPASKFNYTKGNTRKSGMPMDRTNTPATLPFTKLSLNNVNYSSNSHIKQAASGEEILHNNPANPFNPLVVEDNTTANSLNPDLTNSSHKQITTQAHLNLPTNSAQSHLVQSPPQPTNMHAIRHDQLSHMQDTTSHSPII